MIFSEEEREVMRHIDNTKNKLDQLEQKLTALFLAGGMSIPDIARNMGADEIRMEFLLNGLAD